MEDLRAFDLREKRVFEKLVDRYLPVLIGFFCYLGANRVEADDLTQETFLRVVKALDQYDRSRPFLKWITAIARHVFIDHWRKTRKHQEIPTDSTLMERNAAEKDGNRTFLAGSPIPLVEIEPSGREFETVEQLLSELSDDARYLLDMHVVEGLSFPEIAEMTGEAEGTLRVRFHRLLKRLRLAAQPGKTA